MKNESRGLFNPQVVRYKFREQNDLLVKLLAMVFYVFFTNPALAATYYFSSDQGKDNYSSVQAQNANTPWQSLAKLNAFIDKLLPGDSILFRRGDVFYGTITITMSGQPGKPIIFGAYGSGISKPILDGRIKLSNWTSQGNNIWKASSTNLTTVPTALTLDGRLMALGRYPNSDAPNGGYLTISSHPVGSKSQFTCDSLNTSTNWTNAETVVRTTHWTLDRCQATQTGKTITVTPDLDHEVKDKYGFFFQNHPATLDRVGEWCYLNGTVSLFLTSDPNLRDVQIANTPYCITGQQGLANVTIDGLAFIGAKLAAISAPGCQNFVVKNCSFLNSGTNAIDMKSGVNNTILNNNIRWTQNNAIVADGNNTLIHGNNIAQTAMLIGMASSGQSGNGIATYSGTTVQMNVIDTTGYDGITFRGSNVKIINNVVNYFCSVLDDGGGIYTYSGPNENFVNRIVTGNLIMNGIAAPNGTDSNGTYLPANAIYMDGVASNVEIANNTIANCTQAGLLIHNTNLIVKNNLVYNCGYSISIYHSNNVPTYHADIENNTLVKFGPNQYLLGYNNDIYDTNLVSLGVLDNNLYCRPFFEFGDDYISYKIPSSFKPPAPNPSLLNLAGWQKKNGSALDTHSIVSSSVFSIADQIKNSNMVSNANFDTSVNGWIKQDDYGNSSSITWVNGRLDGGAIFFTVSGASSSRLVTKLNLPSTSGRMYRLKMSVISGASGNLGVQLRQNNAPNYGPVSVYHCIPLVGSQRQEIELIIQVDSSETMPWLFLTANGDLAGIHVDNVELVEITIKDLQKFIKFIYNRNPKDSTLILDANYVNPSGTIYSRGNSIKIPATSGIILLADHTPAINWPNPSDIVYGTALSNTQLNATSNVDGTFAYSPTNGTKLNAGGNQSLSVTFKPADAANYISVAKQVSINVSKAPQSITFNPLNDKTLGEAGFGLSATINSPLVISYSSTSDKIAIAGGQVTLLKAGRVSITASQAGDLNYIAATSVGQSFCIKPVKPLVTVTNINTSSPTLTSSALVGNQWYLDGTLLKEGNGVVLNATKSGTYQVQVSADDCTSEFSADQVLVVTGDIKVSTQFMDVYPNPVQDWLSITFGDSAGTKNIAIYETTGKKIIAQSISGSEARLNVSDFAQGIYITKIFAGDVLKVLRFEKL